MISAEQRRQLEIHYLDFFGVAMAMLKDADDAADAVQDALVQVLVKRNVDDVVSYTFKAVRNAALHIMRHRRRVMPLDGIEPEVDTAHEERLRQVARLRDDLPEAQRALLGLYYEEGYTLADLAKLTGMSSSSVRRQIEKIHRTLKKRIEEETL